MDEIHTAIYIKVIEKYPLQDIKDRVRPGSMLDDLAKRDPQAVRQHIRNNDITDQHLAFINTGKINYKQMEKLYQYVLRAEIWLIIYRSIYTIHTYIIITYRVSISNPRAF